MEDYIRPQACIPCLGLDMRGKNNMHKTILNVQKNDLQWLFSPVHIRQVFDQYVLIHKEE